MNVTEVKAHIKQKQFNAFYIFTGDEWAVQRVYINMIAKVSGKELKYVDTIADIVGSLKNRSFTQKSFVYVVRDDKDFLTDEKLQDNLPSLIGKNILIILLTTLDKRLKVYKRYKDTICEFEPLSEAILSKYVQKEIELTEKNTARLIEACESDYGRCLLEIDKIKQYAEGNPTLVSNIYNNSFEMLMNAGAIHRPPKDAIFDFVDAVLQCKSDKALDLYQQCLDVGEATMVMLTVLYNNAKAVLQVQSCKTPDIIKSTGLTKFQVMNAQKHCRIRTNSDLLYIMDLCRECQQGIVTGKIEEEFVMDYILTNIL